jgi:beta-glucosidase
MSFLGLPSYSFTLSWTRLLPEGIGKINARGLDFYDRLLDGLLQSDIKPKVTLHHWDFPQQLQEKGGWPSRDSIEWFTEYAALCFDAFSDRVELWTTFNEPWVIAFLGYGNGLFAPGICDYSKAYQTVHHLLTAHGQVVRMFREKSCRGKIGIVLNIDTYQPESDQQEDLDACRRVKQESTDLFLDPIIYGRYPGDLMEWLGPHHPHIQNGDMEVICEKIDFLGINYYKAFSVSHDIETPLLKARMTPFSVPAWGFSQLGWGIDPSGLSRLLIDLRSRYGDLEFFVTENGIAIEDLVDDKGMVEDQGRIDYIYSHLKEVHRSIESGVRVSGYDVWSFMDNFEWAYGYTPRFGIVYVDYKTQCRIPKNSALWLKKVIEQNAIFE